MSRPPSGSGKFDARPASTIQPSVGQDDADEVFEHDFKTIFTEINLRQADPIAHPIPAIFNEDPILPPAYNATAITCKYIQPDNMEMFSKDIRSSPHWSYLKDDPVFREIDFDSTLIPLDSVVAWSEQRYNRDGSMECEQKLENNSPSLSTKRLWSEEPEDMSKQGSNKSAFEEAEMHFRRTSISGAHERSPFGKAEFLNPDGSNTPVFEGSSTPILQVLDDAWAPQPGEGQLATSPEENSQETLLASLGVTGLPKPVLPMAQSFHPPASHKE